MRLISSFGILALVALLPACGGGGGGGSTSNPLPSAPPVVTPGQSFVASGKPMAFHNAQDNGTTQASMRSALARIAASSMATSPSPSPSASPTTGPTVPPSPTPIPIPSPSGYPQVPTRIGFAAGLLTTGDTIIVQVLTAAVGGTPVYEPTAPVTWTSDPSSISILPGEQLSTVSTANYPDAWDFGVDIGQSLPEHIQGAFQFPDSTGIVDMYRFDGFYLECDTTNSLSAPVTTKIDLTSGIAAVSSPTDAADIGIDCANHVLELPSGYQFVGATAPDVFGSYLQNLADVTVVPADYTSQGTTIAAADLKNYVDGVIVMKDRNGGYHKLMIFNAETDSSGNLSGIYAADLAATGITFPF